MSDQLGDLGERARHSALNVEYPSIDAFLEDYVTNISRGGTMIQIGREIAVEECVELAVSFPGLLTALKLRGVVRWVQRDSATDFSVGVELRAQSHEWDSLAALVQRIREGDRALVAPILRVLVVEDNAHVAKLINDGLAAYRRRSSRPIAFTTRYAANGRDALGLLAEGASDLLVTDMYLPILDGEQLIRAVRGDARWATLPIVAVSAGGEEAKERALAAGADWFVEKPVRLADLLAVVRKVVSDRVERPQPQG